MNVFEAKTERTSGLARQRGAILVITLVILVAMTLASVGLFHSVDTSTLLSANLGFKRDTAARASVGLKGAQIQLRQSNLRSFSESNCVLPACAAGANTYNFSPQALETDSNGIPVILKGSTGTFDSNFPATWTSDATELANMTAAGVTVRYIVERMCDIAGPPDTKRCAYGDVGPLERLDQGDSRGGPGGGNGLLLKAQTIQLPIFRITIRADGPRNTIAYAQAFYNVP